MRLVIDMNLAPRWVEMLAQSGIESVHWSSQGRGNAPDDEIMRYALANGYVILTHDLDFGAMLAAGKADGPSVVQIRAENINPDVIGPRVVIALRSVEEDLGKGALLTIDTDRHRLRLLPLR